MAAIFGSFASQAAYDDSGKIYYLKSGDGLENPITVNGSITFRSQSGTTIPGYRDCGVNFVPAHEGEVIQIRVNEIDLKDPNFLYVYQTPIEKIGNGTSSSGNQSTYFPDGWIYRLDENSTGFAYTSTADDGGLSFAFHSGSAGGQSGFSITVESIALKDMEYVSSYTFSPEASPRIGQADAPVLGICINTNGGLNPLSITNLTVDCSSLANMGANISNVRLYRGNVFSSENLLASADTPTSTISISGVTLKNAKNNFYIVADLGTQAAGSILLPSVTDLKIDGVTRTLDASAPSSINIDPSVWMTKGPATYIVSENLKFYDDGGPDHNISEKFQGTVTFKPATPGNGIKIDFSKLNIFNTSSTGLNDKLLFYNGTEIDDANFIGSLLKTPRIIKSTSPDGAITVSFVSTTGVPAQGWEALVSQYLPGDMVVASVSSEINSDTSNLSAGDSQVNLISFDILTDNNNAPLSLSSIQLASDFPALISAIKIFAIDESTETPVSSLVATLDEPSGLMTVNIPHQLIEGHNRFNVCVDVSPSAVNTDKIHLALKNVTVGSTNYPMDVQAMRDIDNVWKSTDGTKSISLYGPWTFTHTPAAGSSKYAYGSTDQIVSFIPTTPGTVAEISFDSFDVYYASSSYGTKGVFEIYSGPTCDAASLIWKLNSNEDSQKGPGRKIRSGSPDGSLTIRFNPNANSSYYCGNGWLAHVNEFLNHDMKIVGASARRTSTDELGIGASDEDILDFSIEAEGTLSVKELNEIVLDVKGADAVKSVSIYSATDQTGTNPTLFGTADIISDQTVVKGSYELSEGLNYFFTRFDIKEDAAAETAIAMGLLSVKDSKGNTTTFDNCIPDGTRVIKDMLILESGSHSIEVSHPFMWYDDGGANGKISSRISSEYIFSPAQEGYAVTLNSSQFSIGNGRMYVYSGKKADSDKLLGTMTGYSTTTGPSNLISKAEDGSITVVVTGPTGTTLDGFAIQVGLHQKVPFTLESVSSEQLTSGISCLRGSVVPLLKIKTSIEGDISPAEISDLRFSLAGSTTYADIDSLKLYYCGTSPAFSPNHATLMDAVAPSGEVIRFSGSVDPADRGDFYFFLVADINPEAEPGHIISASLDGLTFNSIGSDADNQPTASLEIKSGMTGTYTVGNSSADFIDFQSLSSALSQGIEGPVTVEIISGTYKSNLILSNIPGTSPRNTLSIRAKSGQRDDVIITGLYSAYDKTGIIQIDGTPYVNISDLTVQAGNQSFDNAIYIANGSHHVAIDNISVTADRVTSGYSGINLLRLYSPTSQEGLHNDYFSLEHSYFTGGYTGLYLASNGVVAWQQDKGYSIRNNTLDCIGSKGVYIVDAENVVFDHNILSQPEPKKGFYATDFYRLKKGQITANRIVIGADATANDSYGLYFRQACAGTVENPLLVANNEVVLLNAPSIYTRALVINNDCSNFLVAHNTLRASGTTAYIFATAGSGTPSAIKMVNNLLISDCTASTSTPVYFWNNTDYSGYTFEFNHLFAPSGYAAKNDSQLLDFADFSALVENNSNKCQTPSFYSDSDSHLTELGDFAVENPLAMVSIDRDKRNRHESKPTAGCYEYAPISTEAPEILEGYPQIGVVMPQSASVRTRWNGSGTLYAKIIEWNETATEPDEQSMLSQKAADILADTETTSSFANLNPETTYRVFFLALSPLGIKSEIVATAPFTTPREIMPLKVSFSNALVNTLSGVSVSLTPTISGGIEPYNFAWTSQTNAPLGSESSISVAPSLPEFYTVSVSSADGQTSQAKIAVEVTDVIPTTATFEDIYVPEDSALRPTGSGCFYSGSYKFNFGGMPSKNFWYGYAPSSETSPEFESLSDQFRSAPGGAFQGSNFAVGYPQGLTIQPTGSDEAQIIPGFYVTNSAYARNSMTYGDGFTHKFTQGDWFLLQGQVVLENGKTEIRDLIYLADYRSENPEEHYILDSWKYVDLSEFGPIKSITFTFDGSDKTPKVGLNTPSYLCLDNFGARPDDLTRVETGFDDASLQILSLGNSVRIETSLSDYSVEIFTPAGMTLFHSEGNSGSVNIKREGWSAGIYIVRVTSDRNTVSRRIMIK